MQKRTDLYDQLLGIKTRPMGKILEKPIDLTPLPETVEGNGGRRSLITNSLLRSINLIFTGTERLPGTQTNKKYARNIIKTLEKEVLKKKNERRR